MGAYDDIIHLPHHVSTKHPQMAMRDRAAQFLPFAALSGYDEAVDEAARPTGPKINDESESEPGGRSMFRYAHTNIIARDFQKLVNFYKETLQCKSIGETRDLRGEWLDRLTGIPNAHIVGEHLCLPGYDEDHPTLEIFSYDSMQEASAALNRCGIAHLAFEVDDVEETLQRLLQNGGGQIGEVVHAAYEDGRKAVFVYATDCEGNIIELQSWA